jgi:tetratricopeptide (TPR) repeat protein
MAIGQILARTGQFDRAEIWFRKILSADALDSFALNALIDCLWRQEKWGDAVIFLRKQVELRGELPGLAFGLGKSQFEAGDLSNAVTTLTRLIKALDNDHPIHKAAVDFRERALQLGGAISAMPAPRVLGPVTREDFDGALNDFSLFVAAEKRMRFWVADGNGGHRWVASPEARAQDFLHTFLKSRFGSRVEIFEEIGAGAGRLDLYVRAEGGFSIILELKMCGNPYSSDYAAKGEGQIKHYMENRRTYIGYLIVFDARIRLFGEHLLPSISSPYTIFEKIVDVRNRVQ